MMLTVPQRVRLERFARALVNQDAARIIVPAARPSEGHWFGGGNMISDKKGALYVVGRYRNYGDSRTGLGAGERGKELVIYRSSDGGATWAHLVSWQKPDLDVNGLQVLSIEGSALHWTESGVELFVSTEKAGRDYPQGYEDYMKPGTGIWSIECLKADTVADLKDAPIQTVLHCDDPRWLHVKDPFVMDRFSGDLTLGFCTHPFCWSSSNSGYAVRSAETGDWTAVVYDFFARGFTWDVAITRATAMLSVPRFGAFASGPALTLVFYDGGESMRNMQEHASAHSRPRGFSCEEIGGVAVAAADGVSEIERLSVNEPMFLSPYGWRTSRYVDVLATEGGFYATWQQAQEDYSQPLVMNFVSMAEAKALLS